MLQDDIKKLLVVDDSRVSRMMIRSLILAKHPSWVIIESASGEEALGVVDRDTPNYCTMDINMPGLIGTDAAEQIFAKHPSIRIVIFIHQHSGCFPDSSCCIGCKICFQAHH